MSRDVLVAVSARPRNYCFVSYVDGLAFRLPNNNIRVLLNEVILNDILRLINELTLSGPGLLFVTKDPFAE